MQWVAAMPAWQAGSPCDAEETAEVAKPHNAGQISAALKPEPSQLSCMSDRAGERLDAHTWQASLTETPCLCGRLQCQAYSEWRASKFQRTPNPKAFG